MHGTIERKREQRKITTDKRNDGAGRDVAIEHLVQLTRLVFVEVRRSAECGSRRKVRLATAAEKARTPTAAPGSTLVNFRSIWLLIDFAGEVSCFLGCPYKSSFLFTLNRNVSDTERV